MVRTIRPLDSPYPGLKRAPNANRFSLHAATDEKRDRIMPILASTYGPAAARKWWVYWRVFFMACAELWGYGKGQEWLVSHYLFAPQQAQSRK